MKKTFKVKYEHGHSYEESYEKTELYCPGCGTKGLWDELDAGDYYVGENFVCVACGSVFTMQYQGKREDNWQDRQRVESLLGEQG